MRKDAPGGSHYLMYSYAPGLEIFNGFFQAVLGLYDYGWLTRDARGKKLFRSGDGAARIATPLSDTGSWSLYSVGGPESTRDYDILLRDILRNLCDRTDASAYCDRRSGSRTT